MAAETYLLQPTKKSVFQALCKKSFLETGPDHAKEE
jgi:hypothetical protein